MILGEGYRCAAFQQEKVVREAITNERFAAAKHLYEKSIEIFQPKGEKVECAEAWSNIALCQQRLGQKQASAESIVKAAELLSKSPPTEDKISILDRLGWVSYLLGDEEKSHRFYAEREKLEKQLPQDSNDSTIFAYLALGTLGLALTAFIAKKALLTHYSTKWKQELLVTADAPAQLKLLDKITTVELLRSRLDQADLHSAEMIRVAQSNLC
jgi:tetratricopeptide (TPR) repeat protein